MSARSTPSRSEAELDPVPAEPPLFRLEAMAFRQLGADAHADTGLPGSRLVQLTRGILLLAVLALGAWLITWQVAPGLPLWRWLVGR